MKQFTVGVILAALAMYIWGFIYWTANPLPYTAWQQTNDDAAAGQALLEHFPKSGTYYLPGLYNDEETLSKLHEAGPVAFIHITSREGRAVMEPTLLVKGILLYLVTVLFIGLFLKLAVPSLTSYSSRVRLIVMAGLAAVIMIDLGDAVWWYIPWEWKVHQAIYDFTAWVVAGLVLAKFVKPGTTSTA